MSFFKEILRHQNIVIRVLNCICLPSKKSNSRKYLSTHSSDKKSDAKFVKILLIFNEYFGFD